MIKLFKQPDRFAGIRGLPASERSCRFEVDLVILLPVQDDLARFLFSESWVFLVSGALLATPLIPRGLKKLTAGREERPLVAIGQAALYMLLLVLSVSFLAMGSHNPFIYFTF